MAASALDVEMVTSPAIEKAQDARMTAEHRLHQALGGRHLPTVPEVCGMLKEVWRTRTHEMLAINRIVRRRAKEHSEEARLSPAGLARDRLRTRERNARDLLEESVRRTTWATRQAWELMGGQAWR